MPPRDSTSGGVAPSLAAVAVPELMPPPAPVAPEPAALRTRTSRKPAVAAMPIAAAGLLRMGFGTYLEAFILSGLLCIVAALAVLLIGSGRDREPVAAPVPVPVG